MSRIEYSAGTETVTIDPSVLKANIKTELERLGWTYSDLARALNLRPATVSDWFSKEDRFPSGEAVLAMPLILGVEPARLYYATVASDVEPGDLGEGLKKRLFDVRKSAGPYEPYRAFVAHIKERTGYSVSHASAAGYEKEDGPEPPAPYVFAVCLARNVNPAWLLGGAGPQAFRAEIEDAYRAGAEEACVYIEEALAGVRHTVQAQPALRSEVVTPEALRRARESVATAPSARGNRPSSRA